MDKCVAKVQNIASIPSEKDEAFPPVFRLLDEAFPFDLEFVGVSSKKPKYQAIIYEILVGFQL